MNELKANYFKKDCNIRVNNLVVDGALVLNGFADEQDVSLAVDQIGFVKPEAQQQFAVLRAQRLGQKVTIRLPPLLIAPGDQNSSGGVIVLDRLPTILRPSQVQVLPVITYDGSQASGSRLASGKISIDTNGVIQIFRTLNTAFVASGSSQGLQNAQSIVYVQ